VKTHFGGRNVAAGFTRVDGDGRGREPSPRRPAAVLFGNVKHLGWTPGRSAKYIHSSWSYHSARPPAKNSAIMRERHNIFYGAAIQAGSRRMSSRDAFAELLRSSALCSFFFLLSLPLSLPPSRLERHWPSEVGSSWLDYQFSQSPNPCFESVKFFRTRSCDLH